MNGNDSGALLVLCVYRDSIVDFSASVAGASAKDVMDLLVLNQYFDTLQTVGGTNNSRCIFLASDQSDMSKAIMQGNAGVTAPAIGVSGSGGGGGGGSGGFTGMLSGGNSKR